MEINSFIIAGALLLASLASYAGYLGFMLYRQKVAREQADVELARELKVKESEARESVRIIARALVQNDLTETEAAMRITWLCQQITLSDLEAQQVSVFQQLAHATSHLPILDDWKALSKSDKRRLNKERESIESNFREFTQLSAVELTTFELR